VTLVRSVFALLLLPALAFAQSEEAPPLVPAPAPPASIATSILPRDLSVWGMFLAADWVVQAVMIGLVVASVITWTVFLAKSLELAAAVRRQRQALAAVDGAASLANAPANELVQAAQAEQKQSADTTDDRDGLKERVASRLERLEAAASRRMLKGTGVLATIGATAPFVGLFGTVWGIMNAFIGISRAQTTNLAVVAPGIAEALLATALGLAAAIPAVVIYNHFARRIAAYKALVGDTSAAVLRLVSRDLGRS
jgi:biopolymer transport protein ExbB